MGHILEGSTGNIAAQLRGNVQRSFFGTEQADGNQPSDDHDPWAQAAANLPSHSAAHSTATGAPATSTANFPVTPAAAEEVSNWTDTDSETISSVG